MSTTLRVLIWNRPYLEILSSPVANLSTDGKRTVGAFNPSVRFSSNLDTTSSRYDRFEIISPIARSRSERSIGPDLDIQFGHYHIEFWPNPVLRPNPQISSRKV